MTGLDTPWFGRLGIKLVGLIAAVTLATFAVFAWLGLRADERELVAEVVRGAALFSETIKSSTYHHMLDDRRADAYRVMKTIGSQEGIDKVRIFNKDGQITFSTDGKETGTFVDKRAESCDACHAHDQPIVRLTIPSRSRIYQSKTGHRTLGMVTPIYNEQACNNAACHVHPSSQRILGVVDIGLSLAPIDRDIAALRRAKILSTAAAVLLLGALVGFFANRFVSKPVRALVAGTWRVGQGDLDHEIPAHYRDELGELAHSFNGMTRSLKKARHELDALMASLEKQVEERTAALKEAQGQLIQAEKMSSLGKLSASIAHEINNPLMGILTIAKLLVRTLEEGGLDEAGREVGLKQLKMVQRETERCSAIVRNLLDFARQRPLALKDVDVNSAVEEALSVAANQIAILQIQIEKRLAQVPMVQADLGQLRQAFLNVILNACEAMPKGGTLRIVSRALEGDKAVQVEIGDSGPGIPAELLSKILDPFFTTKEKGTGLGLSVVYGIVQRHGGRLDVQTGAGRGTTMLLTIPTAPPSVERG